MRGARVRLPADRPGWPAEPQKRPAAANDNLARRNNGARDPAGLGAPAPGAAADTGRERVLPVCLALAWITVTLIAMVLTQYPLGSKSPTQPGAAPFKSAENVFRP